MMEGTHTVTSVIIAFNNADTIQSCLDSVLNQAYPLNETVVVCDQGTTDGTEKRLRDLLSTGTKRFEVLSIPHAGRSAARNIGWRHGKGDLVFFADADDVYNPEYLTEAVAAIDSERVGCVCVNGVSLAEGDGLTSRMLKVYSLIQVKKREKTKTNPSWAWVYTRKALEAAEGFDDNLSQGEDKDIFARVTRLGFKAVVVDGVHWSHRRPASASVYFKKTLTGGARRVSYLAKYRDYFGFFKSTGIVWFILAAALLQAAVPWAYLAALSLLILYVGVRSVATAALIWREVSHKTDILVYSLFGLTAHVVTAIGTLVGLATYTRNRGFLPGARS